jgi:hypothetical protein
MVAAYGAAPGLGVPHRPQNRSTVAMLPPQVAHASAPHRLHGAPLSKGVSPQLGQVVVVLTGWLDWRAGWATSTGGARG